MPTTGLPVFAMPSTTRPVQLGSMPITTAAATLGFAPVPILRSELQPSEPIGAEALAAFATAVYGDRDPTEVLHRGQALRVENRGGTRCLVQALPFGSRDELSLARRDDELIVSVGPYRRSMVLPDSLRSRRVTDARLDEGELVVEFT